MNTGKTINLCKICNSNFSHRCYDNLKISNDCALCYGLLTDDTLCTSIVDKVLEVYKHEAFDETRFTLV